MTSPSGTDPASFSPLTAYLQEITEALAATTTQREVIEIILTPAVQALGAVAGIVLLVNQTDQQLKIAGSQGYEDVTLTVWQEGPIEDHQLISDILRLREAKYFEYAGALKAAYPELERRTGALIAIANAVLPMFLDREPLGVIVLDFDEPHDFTPAERRFLKTLAAQCAVALGRAQLSSTLERQIQERTAELAAFVRFTEEVGTETDVLSLAWQAVDVLSVLFPESSSGYYALEEGLWKLKVHSHNLHADPAVLAMLKSGVPMDVAVFAEPLRSAQPVFVDGWDAREAGLEQAQVYHTVGTYPLFVNGSPRAMFGIALTRTTRWSSQEQGVFQSVGRSLELAIERTEVARQLELQNAELHAHTRALEGFAELTRDLGLTGEPDLLIRRAMDLVLSLLPPGYAAFWQIVGGRWQVTGQVGHVGSPELQDAMTAGAPVGLTSSLDLPHQTRAPLFQDHYDPTGDTDPELVPHLSTVATVPVQVNGTVLGVFSTALFGQHPWNAADRAVLLTTVQSLQLALERSAHVRQLVAQRDLLQASNEELEAFTYSVSHDLRTPVRHIVSFGGLLRRSLPGPLGEKTERYFQIVETAANTLNELIDGILELSRTSRQPLKVGRVDLGRLVNSACTELSGVVGGRRVSWQIATLPTVTGDPDLLRSVVLALLNNAVKFTRPRQVAVIEVWAEEQPQSWTVRVRDNGVGFDPQYRDKLFSMFQHLHNQADFEGAGVSLANARRIITRHGGRVMAEGQLDVGATFGFTIPKVMSDAGSAY